MKEILRVNRLRQCLRCGDDVYPGQMNGMALRAAVEIPGVEAIEIKLALCLTCTQDLQSKGAGIVVPQVSVAPR